MLLLFYCGEYSLVSFFVYVQYMDKLKKQCLVRSSSQGTISDYLKRKREEEVEKKLAEELKEFTKAKKSQLSIEKESTYSQRERGENGSSGYKYLR